MGKRIYSLEFRHEAVRASGAATGLVATLLHV